MKSRRFPRYAVDRPLTAVIYWEDHPIRKVHGRCQVLGEGGLGASLADQLYVGEVVRLEMASMPPVYATVRDARGSDHGFEFLYSRYDQRAAVSALCAAMQPSEA